MTSALQLGHGTEIEVNETWRQIGKWTLAYMGASDRAYGTDYVQFHVRGNKRTKRTIRVQLDPSDTYNVEIGYLNHKTFGWVSEAVRRGVYCDVLAETVKDLYDIYS